MHLLRIYIVCIDSGSCQSYLAWALNVLTVSVCVTMQCAANMYMCATSAEMNVCCMQLLHCFAEESCMLLIIYGFKLLPIGSNLRLLLAACKSAELLELNRSPTLLILLLPVHHMTPFSANI